MIPAPLLLILLLPGLARAQDAGALPLRPGETLPPPLQRGLNEIHAVPTVETACPVCGHAVRVPQVDTLMRRPPHRDVGELPWRMHFAYRDDDLCPHPGPGKLAYQADIVVCPRCGYANLALRFADPLDEDGKAWVHATLTPSLKAARTALLGKRAAEMSDDEILDYFADQAMIPDALRTEHYRIYLAAVHAPALDQARACWLAAWAARREVAGPPKGDFLAKHHAAAVAELAKQRRRQPGLHGDIDALRAMMRRARQGKTDLPGAGDMAARLLLAGLWDRMGYLGEAETILTGLYHELRERFLRHEQDPLWSATTARAPQSRRLNELETIRADAEAEVFHRAELVRREKALLAQAATHLRAAIREGAFDADPDQALFHAYLLGEFLRRCGELPLASEWFTNLRSLTPDGSPLARAAERQLGHVGDEAGDRVNLLSALGQDGELFEKLRHICARRDPGAKED